MSNPRINKWSVTDATAQAYKDGYEKGQMDLLLPYDVDSVEDLIETVRTKAIDDCLHAIGNMSLDCYDRIRQLKVHKK